MMSWLTRMDSQKKELAKVKRSVKGKMNVDKEMMDSLKKERKVEVEKEKNREYMGASKATK
jgi:hypothetical protein